MNAGNILYYRKDGRGTGLCLGGAGKDRLVVIIREPPEIVDTLLDFAFDDDKRRPETGRVT